MTLLVLFSNSCFFLHAMRASQVSCPSRVFPRPQPHGEKFEMGSTEGNGILTEENFEQRLSLLVQGTEIILYIM